MSIQTVAIDAAVEGMILACDLCDNNGILLPQGAVLTELSLRSLRRRGIEACEVLVPEPALSPEQRAAELERQHKRLAHLFRLSAAVGATPQLLERLSQYRCRELL